MSRGVRIRTGLILLLLIGLSAGPAAGQKQGRAAPAKHGRVAGFVVDAAGKTPIPQANVMLANTSLGAVSGRNGAFYIERVPPGTYQLVVTMLGYRRMIIKDVVVRAGEVRALRVSLNRQAIDMGKVQVEAKREAQAFQYEKSIAGHEIITPRFIARRPGALEDAYRALNVLPGVTARSDLNTQLYIRGGSPDQNLFLYDGIEITTPGRLFIIMGGGISLVNPDIVQGIDLEPGGFDASHGDKTSALLQIVNREGRRDRTAASASLAMVTARAVAEGPIGKSKGSWLVAGRRKGLVQAPRTARKFDHPALQFNDLGHFLPACLFMESRRNPDERRTANQVLLRALRCNINSPYRQRRLFHSYRIRSSHVFTLRRRRNGPSRPHPGPQRSFQCR